MVESMDVEHTDMEGQLWGLSADFGIRSKSWNQSSMDTEGQLYNQNFFSFIISEKIQIDVK